MYKECRLLLVFELNLIKLLMCESLTDKSDSDEEGTSHGEKFRSRWKMVLNIKKLEHGGKKTEDEESVPPKSPFSRQMTTSPHTSLTTRLVSSK